jgi:hypothetical protein
MTLFEYLSVAVSIVLGLGLTHLLGNLGAVVRPGRRYGAHMGWAALLVLYLLQLWWSMWDLNSGVSWNQFSFYYVMVGPGLLFVAATILIPRHAGQPESWEAHFFQVRRPFLVAVLLFLLWGITVTWLLRGFSLVHPYRATQAVTLFLLFGGLTLESRRFHSILPLVLIVWLLLSQLVFRLLPDAFAVAS